MTTVSAGTEKITNVVKESGGLVKVTLGDLRDSLGYSRLGKHVLTQMETHLTENGLGFFPGDMLDPILNSEPRQWQEIYVFVNDPEDARAEVFRAVANPDEVSLTEALDHLIASVPPKSEPDYSHMSMKDRLALIDKIAAAGNTPAPVKKAAAKKTTAKKATNGGNSKAA